MPLIGLAVMVRRVKGFYKRWIFGAQPCAVLRLCGTARAPPACLHAWTAPPPPTTGRKRRPRGRRPLWPSREASEVSSRRPQGLSPVSQIPRHLCSRLARSFSPLAGSDFVSTPPLTVAQGPWSLAPRVVTLPVPAFGLRACPRSHGTAPQGHPGYVQSRRGGSDGRTFGAYRFLGN
ncbi:hypothetical protein NDU88_001643 [Pleurodeles waltl]|uniref:Uncharacterized protein n=1 Tax=Pleurodeles waltl TaxID=8319 RepID=A0AAV7WMK1_PLEWA|nr:hypothetical protein NDU88_001643 [Pleurodeles waltl]